MDCVLNLSPEEIAQREERRLALSISEVALEAEAVAGGWMCYSKPGCWSNQACGLGMDGPVGSEHVERVVDFYRARNCLPRISACASTDPSLVRALEKHEFAMREVMTVLTRKLPAAADGLDDIRTKPDARLEIREPLPEETALFVEISISGFMEFDRESPGSLAEISGRVVSHPRCTPFLAFWEGEPAGGGLIETLDNQACLIGTSVLPQYRRRGIQRALMTRRMEFAIDSGAQWISVSSLPGIATERNARRIGFTPAYAQATFVQPSS